MKLSYLKLLFFAFLFSVVVTSCSHKNMVPDIAQSKVKISMLRFEQDLFACNLDAFADSVRFLKNKYGEFLDIFNYKVINVGSSNNANYPDLMKAFITDYNIDQTWQSVNSQYKNCDTLYRAISDVFKYYNCYFPNAHIPTLVTLISGFNQSIITTDTLLCISLDKYLGFNCDYYKKLGYPAFMRKRMVAGRIPSDCARSWAKTQFVIKDSATNLLAQMVYEGKIWYFTARMLPYASDTMITMLSKPQLDWCTTNESAMWTYLVEHKLLFQSDYLTMNKFIEDAPFTKDFGQNSPAKAAVWIGWRIVNSYMQHNESVSLEQLMRDNDFQKILQQSKYKP